MISIKKYITVLVLSLFSLAAVATETINIVWGFSIASNQANTVRALIDELNQSQTRYKFMLVHKPGAGGSIAANYVAENPNNAVVSMSSSFIIRPYFEKTGTHDLNNYRPILVQGTGSPLVFVSAKYTNIKQILDATSISIGVSGIGSISHLAANGLTDPKRQINVVNFKNMLDAATAAAGQHVDLAVGFFPDVQSLIDAKKLHVLGYTGSDNIIGYPNLRLDQHKFKNIKMLTANYAIFASKNMDPARLEELHNLLIRANNTILVRNSYARDHINTVNLNLTQSLEWYNAERAYWQQQVSRLKK